MAAIPQYCGLHEMPSLLWILLMFVDIAYESTSVASICIWTGDVNKLVIIHVLLSVSTFLLG